jgi:hypothetical protein
MRLTAYEGPLTVEVQVKPAYNCDAPNEVRLRELLSGAGRLLEMMARGLPADELADWPDEEIEALAHEQEQAAEANAEEPTPAAGRGTGGE